MADETYEQFEERILTKRTVHMLHIINSRLIRDEKVNFGDFVRNHKRKQVSFYVFKTLCWCMANQISVIVLFFDQKQL